MKITKRDASGRVETAESKNLIWIANPRKDIGWEIREKATGNIIWEELTGWLYSDNITKSPPSSEQLVIQMRALRKFVREHNAKSA